MKNKKKKKKVERICTFFLKTGQSIQIKGFEKSNKKHLLFAEVNGRVHKIEKKVISVEIEHLNEIPTHLAHLSTTEKSTVRMILFSGLNLNFNGWKIKGGVDHFLSDAHDVIMLHEDTIYISYGTLIEKESKKFDSKLEEKDGKKRTLN